MAGAPAADNDQRLAVMAWNLLGGLNWDGLPLVVEMLGIDDVDALVRNLVTIRDKKQD